jgi:hypothetical protein
MSLLSREKICRNRILGTSAAGSSGCNNEVVPVTIYKRTSEGKQKDEKTQTDNQVNKDLNRIDRDGVVFLPHFFFTSLFSF